MKTADQNDLELGTVVVLDPMSQPSDFVRKKCLQSDFIAAKGDGGGSDKWIYKPCKTPVKSSPQAQTNQSPTFYRLDALPVSQPTASQQDIHSNNTIQGLCFTHSLFHSIPSHAP